MSSSSPSTVLLFSNLLFSSSLLLSLLCFVLSPSSLASSIHATTRDDKSSLSFARPFQKCVHEHFSALLQLKHGFVFQDGQSKTNLSSWNVDNTDCCSWEGITCNAFTGYVISLNLSSLYISGMIDFQSLFQLRSLQRLDLSRNPFDSFPFPSGFDQLSNLTHLSLSDSNVYGQISLDISHLTRLVHLDLSRDDYCFLLFFCKPALENPGMRTLFQNLTSLRELNMDSINMSAEGSQWSQTLSEILPNLCILSMRRCGLQGPIHPSLSQLRFLTQLHLDGNNLASPVPNFIANFTSLKSLSLSDCHLHGEFPNAIFSLKILQKVDVSWNRFLNSSLPEFSPNNTIQQLIMLTTGLHGKLPDSLGNLKYLTLLDLSGCFLSGSIPQSVVNLTQLVYLNLENNSFSGPIPSTLFSLPSLEKINLGNNHFGGQLVEFPNSSSSLLQEIILSENKLKGPVPSSLFQLTKLARLELSWNDFNSIEFHNVSSSKLKFLPLYSNNIQGTVPREFFELTQLSLLDLSSNNFNSIEIHNISSRLERLYLNNNNFQGPIPTLISELTQLSSLDLSFNNFSGDIDQGLLENLKGLIYLDLSHNSLTAIVNARSNSTSTSFPQLGKLFLGSCAIEEFPDMLRNQEKMRSLDLSNNRLHGKIPQWVWKVGNWGLRSLDLSDNGLEGIEGPFPHFSLTSMGYLDLSFNMLQGSALTPPPSCVFFSLSNNKLSGEISPMICNVTSLEVLDMSSNHFSGLIPQCLGQISDALKVLNLHRNAFQSPLPQTFRKGCKLASLDFSENRFEGQMPRSLVNCRELVVLNLGNNQIQDTFPSWLGSLSSLRVLVLRSNKFHGSIGQPSFTGQTYFPGLQIMDLSSNSFNGSIPTNLFLFWKAMMDGGSASDFLGTQTTNGAYYQDKLILVMKGTETEIVKILIAFTALDLSHNEFDGDIPTSIGELKSLHVLNMSHNRFGGQIPENFERLKDLESLDLSQNSLLGRIPSQLTKLSFLAVLNLSQNQLTGSIPHGGQFDTFDNRSFVGNSGLCGPPLSRKCEEETVSTPSREANNTSELSFMWIGFGVGYGVGVGIFSWALVLWSKGRKAFFIFVDGMLLSSSTLENCCGGQPRADNGRKKKGRKQRK